MSSIKTGNARVLDSWPRVAKMVHAGLSAGYGAVLVLSIISYGANTAIVLTIASSMAFFFLIVSFIIIGEPDKTKVWLWVAFGLLCSVSLWTWIQTLPWPAYLGENRAWIDIAAFSSGVRRSISVTPGDAMLGLVKVGLPFAMFMMSLVLFDSDDRAVVLFKILALGGGCLAILSLAQFILLPDILLIGKKQFYLDSLTGPFVNRNTAGTFFGVVCVMLFALTINSSRKVDPRGLSRVLDRGGQIPQPRELFATILFGLLLSASTAALFLTKSRAATASAFVAILVLAVLMVFVAKSGRARMSGISSRSIALRRILLGLGLIAVTTLVFSILSGRVQLRAEENGVYDPRFCAAISIWAATVDHWILGAGLTSFEEVFPSYRDPRCGVLGKWDKAHNFYLEGLFSLGIVFPVATAITIVSLGKIFFTGLRLRKRRGYIVAAGMSATLLVAVHAFFDFSLQIPGFAVFFAAVLGPVVTVSLGRSDRTPRT